PAGCAARSTRLAWPLPRAGRLSVLRRQGDVGADRQGSALKSTPIVTRSNQPRRTRHALLPGQTQLSWRTQLPEIAIRVYPSTEQRRGAPKPARQTEEITRWEPNLARTAAAV